MYEQGEVQAKSRSQGMDWAEWMKRSIPLTSIKDVDERWALSDPWRRSIRKMYGYQRRYVNVYIDMGWPELNNESESVKRRSRIKEGLNLKRTSGEKFTEIMSVFSLSFLSDIKEFPPKNLISLSFDQCMCTDIHPSHSRRYPKIPTVDCRRRTKRMSVAKISAKNNPK